MNILIVQLLGQLLEPTWQVSTVHLILLLNKVCYMAENSVFTSFEDLLASVPEKGLCKCPLCPETKFQPTWRSRLIQHLKGHWKGGVNCDGKPNVATVDH